MKRRLCLWCVLCLLGAIPVFAGVEKQRLPRLPRRQHAVQDQFRRQGHFAVRGRGQIEIVRARDQRLHQLPRRRHHQTSRRQQAGRAGELRAVPRAADGQLQRQRPRPRAQGRPRRRGDLPRLPRFARDHFRQLADLADLFFTRQAADLRRVPRQGGARLGAERSRQGRGRRFAGRADLHGLP